MISLLAFISCVAGAPQLWQTAWNQPAGAVGPLPEYHRVDQDHFDGSNALTWNQAYFVNDTFWKGPESGAPVFLCVGGEGPALDGSVVVASPHCNIAVEWLEETGGLMFAVEHRYYGCHNLSACPVPNPAAKDALRFLSSRQALGDLVAFHGHATELYKLTPANKWVTWGGSYPGMLAGWARLQFPHLFHCSVASSAPVKAQVDMKGYNDIVAYAYSVSNNDVGGSPACTQAIAKGHAMIGEMFNSSDGRTALAQQFNLLSADWLKNVANQRQFAGNGVAYFPAQGNDPSCKDPSCNINMICKVMTDKSVGDEVARLAQVRQEQNQPQKQEAPAVPDFWGYQTCTEFAFYQSCEVGSDCFFTQGLVTAESEERFCQTLFDIPPDQVAHNVRFSNSFYGADRPGGSRVLYPNGEVDPWSALSVLNSTNPLLPTLMVPGASHHAWTHPSSPDDQKSVQLARTQIKDEVSTWLAEP